MSDVTLMAEKVTECSHTPGPWECEVTDMEGARVYDVADQAMIAVLDKRASEMALFVSSEHTKANARLIAAAPELLHALRKFVEWQDEMKNAVPRIYIDRAKEAIAKAEGRS